MINTDKLMKIMINWVDFFAILALKKINICGIFGFLLLSSIYL